MDTYDNSLWHQLWGQSEAQDGQNPLAAAIAPPGFYAAPEASKESPDAFAAQNPGSIRSQLQNRLHSALGWIDNLAPKTAADAGEMAAYATPGLGQYLSTKDLVKAGSSGDWRGAGLALAGMFGGPLAKTADHAALARAGEMHAAGHTAEDIWHQTGWFQGRDDKWRFEIPDDQAAYVAPRNRGGSSTVKTVSDVVGHNDLYAAYPELGGIRTSWAVDPNKTNFAGGGAYYPAGYKNPIEAIGVSGGSKPEVLSNYLRECRNACEQARGGERVCVRVCRRRVCLCVRVCARAYVRACACLLRVSDLGKQGYQPPPLRPQEPPASSV